MPTSTTQTRHRKIRAVLAAGLVLGIGGAVTLAAWNDSEFAQGTFTAGTFNLQGNATSPDDEESWGDHDSVDGAAQLSFTLPADNLAPGDVVYAPFWVRLGPGTTSPATLVAKTPTATGDNVDYISYQVRHIAAGATCNETATAGEAPAPVVAAGGELDRLASGGASVPLAVGQDINQDGKPDAAGDAEQLCFVVTAKDGLAQSDPDAEQPSKTTATWQFTATSTE